MKILSHIPVKMSRRQLRGWEWKTANMTDLSRSFPIKESKEMGLRPTGEVRLREKIFFFDLGKVATGLHRGGNEHGE